MRRNRYPFSVYLLSFFIRHCRGAHRRNDKRIAVDERTEPVAIIHGDGL
ncbi:MAG: hypothetical protein L0220_18445 [Acidobacteria bacterium]|nr:hypothetical protein [Acidobacteriota bacterium]